MPSFRNCLTNDPGCLPAELSYDSGSGRGALAHEKLIDGESAGTGEDERREDNQVERRAEPIFAELNAGIERSGHSKRGAGSKYPGQTTAPDQKGAD